MAIKADLAFVFHWSPDDIGNLEFEDLMVFHDLAMERLRTRLV